MKATALGRLGEAAIRRGLSHEALAAASCFARLLAYRIKGLQPCRRHIETCKAEWGMHMEVLANLVKNEK